MVDQKKGVEMELTLNGTPRKRRRLKPLKAYAPLISGRAPASIVEMVKAKATARKVSVGVILREALESYLMNDEGRNHAA
jgi:hypothetical protein